MLMTIGELKEQNMDKKWKLRRSFKVILGGKKKKQDDELESHTGFIISVSTRLQEMLDRMALKDSFTLIRNNRGDC